MSYPIQIPASRYPIKDYHFLVGTIAFYCIMTCLASASGPAVSSSSSLDKIISEPAWLQQFKGQIRIWTCSWGFNDDGTTVPNTIKISIIDKRMSKQGQETWQLTWESPYLKDLSPDFEFRQETMANRIHLYGRKQSGIRGIIFPPDQGIPLEKTDVYSYFKYPQMLGAHRVSGMAVQESSLTSIAESHRKDYVALSGYCASVNYGDPSCSYHILLYTSGLSDNYTSIAGAMQEVPGERLCAPAAMDIAYAYGDNVKEEWKGTGTYINRVLGWTQIQSPETLSSLSSRQVMVPHIVVEEATCKRPGHPDKSYNNRAITVIEVVWNDAEKLTEEWQSLLPGGYRILDTINNEVRVTERKMELPLLTNYLNEINDAANGFVRLIKSDLGSAYTEAFLPVGNYLPPEVESNGMEMTASWNKSPFKMMNVSPEVAAYIEQHQNTDLQTILTDNASLSYLLGFLSMAVESERKSGPQVPRRMGRQPVPKEVQKECISHLIIISGLAIVIGILSCITYLYRELKDLKGPFNNNSMPGRLLGIILVMPVTASLSHADPILDSPWEREKLYNVEEVKRLIENHCAIITISDPNALPDTLYARLLENHRTLLSRLEFDETKAGLQPKFTSEVVGKLESIYRSPIDPVKTDSGPADWPDLNNISSTLNTVLNGRTSDCYTLALGYYLHFRLLDIELNLLALPEHVILYFPGDTLMELASMNASMPCGKQLVGSVYDPSIRKWLQAEEIDQMLKEGHHFLSESEIPSVIAFNLGTTLSRKGNLEDGTLLLEQAGRLGFPFEKWVTNLCMNYYQRKEYHRIIDVVETMKGQCHISEYLSMENAHPSEGAYSAISDVQERYSIVCLYFHALMNVGRREQAVEVAHQIMNYPFKKPDYGIYRAYLQLKKSSVQQGTP